MKQMIFKKYTSGKYLVNNQLNLLELFICFQYGN